MFEKNENGQVEKIRLLSTPANDYTLFIGQEGVLDDERWEVCAASIKFPKNEPEYPWQEYTLYNSKGDIRFLSEYNGHWTLAKEIEDGKKYDIDKYSGIFEGDDEYRLFNDSTYQAATVSGVFEHPLSLSGILKDFVSPPKAILLERDDNETVVYAFNARYVSKKEMAKAFPGANLPKAEGVGMLQPFPFDLGRFGYIMGAFGLFIVLIQVYLTAFHPSSMVLSEYVMLPDTIPEVNYVSPSFQFTGIKGPLQIDMSAPVENSWADVDFTLVNEETQAEQYGSIEIAYYYGQEGGESWSEGNPNPCVKICGVTPGRYHLAMQIAKQPNTSAINSVRYRVTTQASTHWNAILSLILLMASFIGVLIYRSNFERNRWIISDYPPESE